MRVFILTAGLLLVCCQPCRSQGDAERDWVNKHFGSVMDELLPIYDLPGMPVAYRSYRDLYTDVLEYSFILDMAWQGRRINVVVRVADQVSIYDQMMALHRQNPSESIESIKKKLKLKEWRFTDQSCPAVKIPYERFHRLSLPMLSAEERAEKAKGMTTIFLHPTVHTFTAHITGGEAKIVLVDQSHPFVRWATRTRRALEKCALREKRGGLSVSR